MRGGISQVINDFMLSLGIELPSWAGGVLILGLLLLFFPSFSKNAKIKQARILWKSSFFASIDERMSLQEEALRLVEKNESGLLGLVELAIQSSQLKLAEETLSRIEIQSSTSNREIRRLRFRIEQKANKPS
jgi:hypothetical protein